DEAALSLIATRIDGLFHAYPQTNMAGVSGVLRINPLYKVEQNNGAAILGLHFPSPEYEEEFGLCKQYLPERVEISAHMLKELSPADEEVQQLLERRVVLDLPSGYLPAGV